MRLQSVPLHGLRVRFGDGGFQGLRLRAMRVRRRLRLRRVSEMGVRGAERVPRTAQEGAFTRD